jgi:preprotein translocase subunit SecA
MYEEKERQIGPEAMLYHERMIMLQIVDTQWKDHLYALDHLKEGIGLRGYGQRDPLVEYKKESFNMYQALRDRIDEEILRWVFLAQPVPAGANGGERPAVDEPVSAPAPRPRAREPELALAGARTAPRNLSFNDPGELLSGSRSALGAAQPKEAEGGTDEVTTVRRDSPKVGRNDPCPCGSGKKYKKCHGA